MQIFVPILLFIALGIGWLVEKIRNELTYKLERAQNRNYIMEDRLRDLQVRLDEAAGITLLALPPATETSDQKLARLMQEHERVKEENSALTSENAMLKRTSPFR